VIKKYFLETVKALRELSEDELLDQRYKRLTAVGAYSE
jgi:acetyl-CoA carboxylase carboxyl transferase subunit alpha